MFPAALVPARPRDEVSRVKRREKAYNSAMTYDLSAIREALQYLAASGVPVQHKKIMTAVLEEALANALQTHAGDWQPADMQIITDALQGRVAISWQHADELLFKLSGQLHRSPDEVKKKAVEAGFGAGVDYWQAKKARTRGENI